MNRHRTGDLWCSELWVTQWYSAQPATAAAPSSGKPEAWRAPWRQIVEIGWNRFGCLPIGWKSLVPLKGTAELGIVLGIEILGTLKISRNHVFLLQKEKWGFRTYLHLSGSLQASSGLKAASTAFRFWPQDSCSTSGCEAISESLRVSKSHF